MRRGQPEVRRVFYLQKLTTASGHVHLVQEAAEVEAVPILLRGRVDDHQPLLPPQLNNGRHVNPVTLWALLKLVLVTGDLNRWLQGDESAQAIVGLLDRGGVGWRGDYLEPGRQRSRRRRPTRPRAEASLSAHAVTAGGGVLGSRRRV